jgi:hypothetical protein
MQIPPEEKMDKDRYMSFTDQKDRVNLLPNLLILKL